MNPADTIQIMPPDRERERAEHYAEIAIHNGCRVRFLLSFVRSLAERDDETGESARRHLLSLEAHYPERQS